MKGKNSSFHILQISFPKNMYNKKAQISLDLIILELVLFLFIVTQNNLLESMQMLAISHQKK